MLQEGVPSQCRLACGLLMGGQDATPSQCRLADDLGWLRMFAPSKVGSIEDKWRLVDTCGLTGRNVFIWVFCRGGYMVRISLRWYRCSGRMVPRGAEPWYRSYRSDGTGTKCPLYTLSKGALQIVLQGTLS